LAADAWSILRENAPTVHSLLLRLTLRQDVAEDLLQELFVKLAGRIGGAKDPLAYMCRTAINLAMDWRRGDGRMFCKVDVLDKIASAGAGPETALEQADDIERILDAVQKLSELQREAFVLRFVQQEPYERVGHFIGKTAQQARGLCDAAIKRIRLELRETEVSRE
jgi:RNA polymerase sigma factor (sigma-70 family)